MTDEKSDAPGTSAPPVVEQATSIPSAPFGVPLEAFVRGQRSRPAAHERMLAEEHEDAERRRAVADQECKEAKKPIVQGGAMLYTNKFQESPEASESFFALEYVTERGEPLYMHGQELGCLADVTAMPDGSVQFHIVCPQCKAEGLHQERCQMRVNSKNKKFEIDFSTAGDLVMFNDGFGPKPYRSAGVLRETERLRCDQCGWACRIIKNKVRPA